MPSPTMATFRPWARSAFTRSNFCSGKFCLDIVDFQLAGDAVCDRFSVPGNQHRAKSHGMKACNCLNGVRAKDIGNTDDPERRPPPCDKDFRCRIVIARVKRRPSNLPGLERKLCCRRDLLAA